MKRMVRSRTMQDDGLTDLQRAAKAALEKRRGALPEPRGKLPPTESHVEPHRVGEGFTSYSKAPSERRMYMAVRVYGPRPAWLDDYGILDQIAADAEVAINEKLEGTGARAHIRLIMHTSANLEGMVEAEAGSIVSGVIQVEPPA